MNPAPRFRVVFVLGIAHGGSTLLGRMLNRHPVIVCPGELLRLAEAREKGHPCFCGESIDECAAWQRRLREIPEKMARKFRKWTVPALTEMAARENGQILLDLSKTRAHRLARKWTDPEVGFLLMIRDPRGAMRGSGANGADLRGRIQVYRRWTKRFEKFEAKAGDRLAKIYYEDLVRDPEGVLKRVCAHLGIDFRPEMLRPDDGEHHFVHSSRSPYRKGENKFALDERWRQELSQEQLAAIEKGLGKFAMYRGRYFG